MVLISAIIAVTIVSCKNAAAEPQEQKQTTTAAAVTEKQTEKPKKQPNSVSVGTPMLTIGIGENADLQAHYDGSLPAEDAAYSSDRAGVVTIDEAAGRVTGKAEGGTVVTVKSANNKTAHCFVTVKKAPTKVSFPVDKLNMLAGEQTTLTLIPAEGEGFSAVTLTSSDSGVVSIAANGLVTAGKAGTATVTGTTFNGQKATCTVTVLENNGVTDRQTAVDADLLREPGWQFPSVQKVPAGSRVSQYGQSDDGRWIKVKYNDSTGWMYNKAFGEITNYSQFNTRTLPVMADDLLFDVTTDKRAIFDFVYQISYDTNGDNSVENLCVEYFKRQRGSCFHHAAMLCYLYNRCGYETYKVNGLSAYDGVSEHSWCISKTDEGWLHVDAQEFSIRTADEQYFIDDYSQFFNWDKEAFPPTGRPAD